MIESDEEENMSRGPGGFIYLASVHAKGGTGGVLGSGRLRWAEREGARNVSR
jgi:hypothetical protein